MKHFLIWFSYFCSQTFAFEEAEDRHDLDTVRNKNKHLMLGSLERTDAQVELPMTDSPTLQMDKIAIELLLKCY